MNRGVYEIISQTNLFLQTIASLRAIFVIFTILDSLTIILQYFYNSLQYFYNTFTMLLQYNTLYNTLTIPTPSWQFQIESNTDYEIGELLSAVT